MAMASNCSIDNSNSKTGLQYLVEAYNDIDDNDYEVPDQKNVDKEKDKNSSSSSAAVELSPLERPSSSSTSSSTNELKKELLPLPSDIANMYLDLGLDSIVENGDLFGGRVRTFPHVRGNWATFVYIPFSMDQLEMLINLLQNVLRPLEDSGPKIILNDEFHLSISKTVVLHHHWIGSFIGSLRKYFSCRRSFKLRIKEFEVYVNDEKTRTFIAASVLPSETLQSLVGHCDTCFAEYGLESYYKNPSHHISLASCVGDHEDFIRSQILLGLNKKLGLQLDLEEDDAFHIREVEIKTGNKVYRFDLDSSWQIHHGHCKLRFK